MSRTADKPIAWNLNRASKEFGVHRNTLSARLTAAGHAPDADGTFTTQQIFKALAGDREAERLRLLTEQADAVAIENRRARGELIEVTEAIDIAAQIAAGIKAKVLALPLPRDTLKGLLAELEALQNVDFEKEAKRGAGDS